MPTISEKQVLDLVDLAYEAALDPTEEGLKHFYLNFAELVSARGGGLSVFHKESATHREIAHLHDPELVKELNTDVYLKLPFRERLEYLGIGQVFDRRRDFPDTEFLGTEVFEDFFRRWGIYQFLHQKVYDDTHFSIGLGFTWPMENADLDRDARKAMDVVFPHVRRSLDIFLDNLRKKTEKGLLLRALAEVDPAIVVVEEGGRVVLCNAKAEELLACRSEIHLDHKGSIALRSPSQTRRLRRAIAKLSAGDPDGPSSADVEMMLDSTDGEALFELKLSRIDASGSFEIRPNNHVLISVRPCFGQADRVEKDLKRLYGLTPAEERLARMLAHGHSISESCEILNVSANTARTHLKRVFSKTDTHRQSMLVKLILSN